MWDKVLETTATAVAVAGAAFVGWWGYKQWKNGLHDEICDWLRARPNVKLSRVVLRLVDSLDEAMTRGEGMFRCAVLGETARGQLTMITEKKVTAAQMRSAGLSIDSGKQNEVELFSDKDLAKMTAGC
ncbi:MAG: hypothetical protein IKU86_11690 [Thermoguttaceae bacterium]|nr:hypothetical protein [Thermoguttaceae bacterium]